MYDVAHCFLIFTYTGTGLNEIYTTKKYDFFLWFLLKEKCNLVKLIVLIYEKANCDICHTRLF